MYSFFITEYIPIKDTKFENAGKRRLNLKENRVDLMEGPFSSAKYCGMFGVLQAAPFNLVYEAWYYHHSVGQTMERMLLLV